MPTLSDYDLTYSVGPTAHDWIEIEEIAQSLDCSHATNTTDTASSCILSWVVVTVLPEANITRETQKQPSIIALTSVHFNTSVYEEGY